MAGPVALDSFSELFDAANRFVTENDRQRDGELPFPEVNIRAADAGHLRANQCRACLELVRQREFCTAQRRVELFEDGSFGVRHETGTLSGRGLTFNAELEAVVGCFGPIWSVPVSRKIQDFRFHRGSPAVSPHQSSPVNLVAQTRNCQPGTSVHAPYSAGSSGFGSGSQNDVMKPIA